MIFIRKEQKEMNENDQQLGRYLSWKEYFIVWSLIIIFFSGENYLAKIIYNYF